MLLAALLSSMLCFMGTSFSTQSGQLACSCMASCLPFHALYVQEEVAEFESLVGTACRQQLLADVWVRADLPLVSDSEHFFLFEDTLG